MRSDTETIGNYRVIRPIGKGGMAEIFAVEKTGPAGFEKQLCLKRIRRDYADNIDFVTAFESEARIISRLQHPNIVQVFDFFQNENDLCLVMELIDGLDLCEVLKLINRFGLLLPVDVAVYILESLLLALHHAHTLDVKGETVSVIHRDISPHNLLISTAGVVKLADFGVAKAKGMSQKTKTGVLKGKLCYMSPEQLKGGGAPIGPESDLFAAGIVFWEMLAKERLFKATMEHQIFANVMNFEKAPIDHLHPRINAFLERILAPKPEDRFSSAREALDALKRIGVRPCSQADVEQIVTALKTSKDLYSARQTVKTVEEDCVLSATDRHRTEFDGNSSQTLDDYEPHDSIMARDLDKESVMLPEAPRRFSPVFTIVIIAAILIVIAIWCVLRRDENADTETGREAPPITSGKRAAEEPSEKQENTSANTLKSPALLPRSNVGSLRYEEEENQEAEDTQPHTESRLNDETAPKEQSPETNKPKRLRRKLEKRNPKSDSMKKRKLIPFSAK